VEWADRISVQGRRLDFLYNWPSSRADSRVSNSPDPSSPPHVYPRDPFPVYGSFSIPDDFGWPCRASSLIIRDCETLRELLQSH